jgi:hypothetical protein
MLYPVGDRSSCTTYSTEIVGLIPIRDIDPCPQLSLVSVATRCPEQVKDLKGRHSIPSRPTCRQTIYALQ